MTTQQTYALFAIVVCLIILIGISYCAGLKTGSRAAEQKASTKAEEHAANYAVMLDDLRNSYATSIEQHQAQLDEVIQDADHRIAAYARRSNAFTAEDKTTLRAIANKLELAGNVFAGMRADDHARFARTLQALALNMAERLRIALEQAPIELAHPDTQLIEWLDSYATYNGDDECGELRFPVNSPLEGFEHVRDVLTLAVKQQQTDDYSIEMGAAA